MLASGRETVVYGGNRGLKLRRLAYGKDCRSSRQRKHNGMNNGNSRRPQCIRTWTVTVRASPIPTGEARLADYDDEEDNIHADGDADGEEDSRAEDDDVSVITESNQHPAANGNTPRLPRFQGPREPDEAHRVGPLGYVLGRATAASGQRTIRTVPDGLRNKPGDARASRVKDARPGTVSPSKTRSSQRGSLGGDSDDIQRTAKPQEGISRRVG